VKATSTALQTALANGPALAQLVLIIFPSGQIAVNTSSFDLDWLGITYKGAGGLGSIVAIHDQPGEIQGVQFELNGGPSAFISLALDEANEVQGSPVVLRTAILSGEPLAVIDAPVEWIGSCDTMSITEDGTRASISVTAESKAVALLRGTPLTYSDADQKSIDPADRAFEYVIDQTNKPIIWPKREWFYQ